MARTTQCTDCGVVLNVPDQAIGKRLKCPKCGTRFAVSPDAEDSPGSTYVLPTNKPPSSQEQLSSRPLDPDTIPTAAGDLRDTFDLPLMNEAAPGPSGRGAVNATQGAKPTADAMALFVEDARPVKRRPSAAEARSKARRCPTCSTVVPVGMSVCTKCGLDLETGMRVDLDEDLAPPAPPAPTMPLPVGIIGGICFLTSLIMAIATASLWVRGTEGLLYFVPVCLFGVFASVQFLRRKTAKLLLVALTFGVAIDLVALIAMPIYYANVDMTAVQQAVPHDETGIDIAIPSVVDRLDTQTLTTGILLIFIYAGVAVYLLSPQVRRYFRQL